MGCDLMIDKVYTSTKLRLRHIRYINFALLNENILLLILIKLREKHTGRSAREITYYYCTLCNGNDIHIAETFIIRKLIRDMESSVYEIPNYLYNNQLFEFGTIEMGNVQLPNGGGNINTSINMISIPASMIKVREKMMGRSARESKFCPSNKHAIECITYKKIVLCMFVYMLTELYQHYNWCLILKIVLTNQYE